MKKIEDDLNEIRNELRSVTGLFDGLLMMSNNPGVDNISKMFHSNVKNIFDRLYSIELRIKEKCNNEN